MGEASVKTLRRLHHRTALASNGLDCLPAGNAQRTGLFCANKKLVKGIG